MGSSGFEYRTRNLNCSLTREGSLGSFGRLDTSELSIAVVDFKTNSFDSYVLGPDFFQLDDVVISPDGNLLAFVVYSRSSSVESEIWVINREGLVKLRLVGLGQAKVKPNFSPSCDKLIFFADMRHQYLSEANRALFDITNPGSMAVHELNLEDGRIRLLDLPILPSAKGAFYTNDNTVVAAWLQDLIDPEFSQLPVDCVCGRPKSADYGGNFWQRIRPRFQLSVGEAQLLDRDVSKFKKFELTLPKFESIRDTFRLTASPCEAGFLSVLELWDSSQDPGPELFKYPSYRPPDSSRVGLSWLTRDGGRQDIVLPIEFRDMPAACGSYDKSRVIAWAGNADASAAALRYPWTQEDSSKWESVDLQKKYQLAQTFEIKTNQNTSLIEIPKLIDKNGVGRTEEGRFLEYGASK